MNDNEQTAVFWTSLRAWQGSSKRSFQAWCSEWVRHEILSKKANCTESVFESQGCIHVALENGDEWHWLILDDVDYFGMAESRELTKYVIQYIVDHPKIVQLTFSLPYPFSRRVCAGHEEERAEWKIFLTRCVQMAKTQGRLISFLFWDLSAWHKQWDRKKREGTLAFWFAEESLSVEWVKAQTQDVLTKLQMGHFHSHLKTSPTSSSLDAWFREPAYFQKVSQLRRKLQRYTHLITTYPLSNVDEFQKDLKDVIEELWLQPMFQRSFWSNQRMMMCLGRLHDQLVISLNQMERATSGNGKEIKKSLLHWMRLVNEVEQFVEQPHWRAFHMPYMITTDSIITEKNTFQDMLHRGINGKRPFLLLVDDDSKLDSSGLWQATINDFSCPSLVLWETLQILGDNMRSPILLVVISIARRSQIEWQSWTSKLMTQWMKYPRLSCWIHRLEE